MSVVPRLLAGWPCTFDPDKGAVPPTGPYNSVGQSWLLDGQAPGAVAVGIERTIGVDRLHEDNRAGAGIGKSYARSQHDLRVVNLSGGGRDILGAVEVDLVSPASRPVFWSGSLRPRYCR